MAATQGYIGVVEFKNVTSGTVGSADALSVASSGWNELKYVSATVNRSRNQVDITESSRSDPGMEKFPVLSDFNMSFEFVKKKSGDAGFAAQDALKTALSAAQPDRVFIRVMPDGKASGEDVEWGEVIVTGFNTTRPTNDVVRISLSLEGTGPRADGTLTV